MDDRSRAIDAQLDRIEEKIRRLATIADMQIDSHDQLRAETERRFQVVADGFARMQAQVTQSEAAHDRKAKEIWRMIEATQRQLDHLSTVVNGHTTNPQAHE